MTYEQFFKDGITETQQQVGFKIDKQLVLSFYDRNTTASWVLKSINNGTCPFYERLGFVPGEAGGGVSDSSGLGSGLAPP